MNRVTVSFRLVLLGLAFCSSLLLVSCHQSQPKITKRYAFTGRIVSIDVQDQSAIIDGDKITGFMDAMAMNYKIKPPTILQQLSQGDSITADVVIQSDANHPDAVSEYWLENVKVTAHAKQSPAASSNTRTATGRFLI